MAGPVLTVLWAAMCASAGCVLSSAFGGLGFMLFMWFFSVAMFGALAAAMLRWRSE